jgi:WD40 repeat protein
MVARATSGLGAGTCTVVKMSECLAGFRGFQEPGEEEDDNVANPNGTGKVLLEFEFSDSTSSSSLAFSPDGKAFAWGRDASVKVWSMSDGMWDGCPDDDIMYEWMEEYGGEEGEVGNPTADWFVTCIALSAARQSCTGKPLLAVANKIRFFILEGEEEDGFFHQPPKVVRQIARGMAIAFSPRANVLAVSADDNVRL